jgi:hypothetical protein
LFLFEGI